MSMNLAGAIAEPASVDAQYSLQGGVTVLVTGRITYPVSCSVFMSKAINPVRLYFHGGFAYYRVRSRRRLFRHSSWQLKKRDTLS